MSEITAEDSRALLEFMDPDGLCGGWIAHLRAALDREAALIAERDAARAEVDAAIDRMEVEVRLLLAEYFRRGVSQEKWEDAAGVAARRVRAALASEPGQ